MAKKSICAWQDLALGCSILEAGSAAKLKTGDWRTMIPRLNEDECIKCGMCAVYCPEFCITEHGDGFFRPNFDYCKGCGICSNICPKSAISMAIEEK